eukprot:gnl/Dysnectes_brevis/765_a842_3568.p1 GENE.gnl/Dysnectes_brevis/765_a842_3568~~gnl/Dysnectes_brevis/765_a842_3568.p1  ORF type:complete len:388 (-),score=95.84 gnl/Dysnectes_brevis/765_a842_3568:48-1211(-)
MLDLVRDHGHGSITFDVSKNSTSLLPRIHSNLSNPKHQLKYRILVEGKPHTDWKTVGPQAAPRPVAPPPSIEQLQLQQKDKIIEDLQGKNQQLTARLQQLTACVEELESRYTRIDPSLSTIVIRPEQSEYNLGTQARLRVEVVIRNSRGLPCDGPDPLLLLRGPEGEEHPLTIEDGRVKWTPTVLGMHALELSAGELRHSVSAAVHPSPEDSELEHPGAHPDVMGVVHPQEDLEEDFLCASCRGLPVDPRVLGCAEKHLLCWFCWHQCGGSLACPLCRSETTKIHPIPKLLRRMLDDIYGQCPFCSNEVGTLEWEEHLASCSELPRQCVHAPRGCKAQVTQRYMSEHARSECDYRIVSCRRCRFKCHFRDLNEHFERCTTFFESLPQ